MLISNVTNPEVGQATLENTNSRSPLLFSKFWKLWTHPGKMFIHNVMYRLGTIHIWPPWKLSNFQDSPPPCPSTSKTFPPSKTNYGTTTAPRMWTNDIKTKNQVTSHSKWPRVLLFDLAHKQCNRIIKGWLHCLTPESVGKFLVSNILMFDSAWCLWMAQIQFSLIKK